jgi:hypothetical protein
MRRATRAGGTRLTFPKGEGVLITTPLVSVLAMDADSGGQTFGQTFLLAGLVDPKLLRQAGSELSTFREAR